VRFVRYGIPALAFLAGCVILIARNADSTGLEIWAMFTGVALSVLLFNVLFRFGAAGDKERQAEEDAREFLSAHGHWPDEPPPAR
jgi:hypothetical protein